MATIYHQVSINAPVAKVYEAISTPDGIGTWWDKQTSTQTDRGLVLEHNPGPEHGVVKLRVVELVPNKRVEWECISTHPKSSPASAWTGTHFIFEIAERGGNAASSGSGRNQDCTTTLDFRQTGYDEQSEYFGSNNFAWGQVLQNLKQVVESQRS
ncbi:MAG TPA: SRPBCC domain-containing protein [Candidatus Methylomirabilis sp.]|nr:SRPBCC domain-containing protein [Candidatus Methylomirabilis sp.]